MYFSVSNSKNLTFILHGKTKRNFKDIFEPFCPKREFSLNPAPPIFSIYTAFPSSKNQQNLQNKTYQTLANRVCAYVTYSKS